MNILHYISLQKQNHLILFLLFFLCHQYVFSQKTTKDTFSLISAHKNVTHTFGVQYNNCIYNKGKFKDQTQSDFGLYPIYSYGNEIIIKYNLTHKTNAGFTFEFMIGNMAYGFNNKNPNISRRVNDITSRFVFLFPDYLGFNVKGSYRVKLNEVISLQPEMGFKMAYYPKFETQYDFTDLNTGILYIYMSGNNYDCKRFFYPDLTMSLDFMFHTKRNPRNNFVLGINANIGFTPRLKAYYSLNPHRQVDGKITYHSTYLGLNLGYEFISFQKTFNRKEEKKNKKDEYFIDQKFMHSFGVLFNNGFGFPTKNIEQKGIIFPYFRKIEYNPELALKYNCSFRKRWGFTIEFPIGFFNRRADSDISGIVPPDSIQSRGDVLVSADLFGTGILYYSLACKVSFLMKIHRNVYMQPEMGIKFMPFAVQPYQFDSIWYFNVIDTTYNQTIPYMACTLDIDKKLYFVPDLTAGINFYIHGKNPSHNFVVGISANICFVNRLAWHYQTTANISDKYVSSGRFNWKSSTIGFHVGYLFMYGKKKVFQKYI